MKKKFIWGIVIIFVLNILLPVLNIHSVFAVEQDKTVQTIIKKDDLSVYVTPTISEGQIQWQVDYEHTVPKESNFQRLKFRLLLNDKVSPFPSQENWESVDDNWFGEQTFTKQSKGSVTFLTDIQTEKVQIEVQLDEASTAEGVKETIIQNVLERHNQGPFDLQLPQNYSNSSIKQGKEESGSSEKAQEQENKISKNESQTPSESEENTSTQNIQAATPNYARSITALLAEGQRIYSDLFTYSKDSDGQYPLHGTNNYTTTNQSSFIKNFDFGSNAGHTPATDQANVQNYTGVSDILGNSKLNFDEGYHFYQVKGAETGVYTKKTVTPTTDPNTFDVQVDVVGGASKIVTQEPIDIALVIDRSGSMNDSTKVGKEFRWAWNWTQGWHQIPVSYFTRFELLQNAVDAFASNLLDGSGNVRIGLASFQSTSDNTSGKPLADIAKFDSRGFTASKSTLINHTILTSAPIGGTPTYLGVEAGIKLLTDQRYKSRPDAKKVLIVLTDGEPTYWPKKYDNNNNYSSINDVKTDFSNSLYDRYEGIRDKYSGNGASNQDETYSYTSSGIKQYLNTVDIDKKITSRYSIAFGPDVEKAGKTQEMLNSIGSLYDGSDESNISSIFEQIRREIVNYKSHIDDGQLMDPMSPYVELSGSTGDSEKIPYTKSALQLNSINGIKTLKVTPESDEQNYPAYAANIKGGWDASSNNFLFTNMNLGSADGSVQNGFRLNYKVQLKENFRNGNFYPTNGPTYVNGRTYDHSLGFAIPSVRSEAFSLDVEKVWSGDSDYTDLRKPVVFQLQQKKDQDTTWVNVPDKSLTISTETTGNALKGTFSGLPAISITKNANGTLNYQKLFYRVIEKDRTSGYQNPVVTPSEGVSIDSTDKKIVVTNSLLTTDVNFTKVAEDGKNLKGAGFTLYRKIKGESKELKTINDPDKGSFTFYKIPIGEYVLKETKTPAGFATREDVEFSVQDSSSGHPTINVTKGTLDDVSSADGNQIMNHLVPLTLSVDKQDIQTKAPLSDVTFTLIEKDTEKEIASMKTSEKGVGTFLDSKQVPVKLATGKTYVIVETKEHEGYILDKRKLEVTVNADGSLKITRNGQDYEEYVKNNQEIQVTIFNQQKGLLPSTGGNGPRIYLIFAGACFLLAISSAGIYFYRNRKEVHR